ncbi:natural resistance-associated macrophage protein [Xylariaceae sp. FL0594]|nr:natural resistance-associated macrophage protein [Xylariaceae sp. FL0594]
MNKTSRTNEPHVGAGLNQSPDALSNDLITNQDLNGIANSREHPQGDPGKARSFEDSGQPIGSAAAALYSRNCTADGNGVDVTRPHKGLVGSGDNQSPGIKKTTRASQVSGGAAAAAQDDDSSAAARVDPPRTPSPPGEGPEGLLRKLMYRIITFGKFVGPGFLVAVAYIDPGNYSTDVSAGAAYRFRLLFIVLLSNLFAVLLQCLAVKLGTVTGLNLAEACRVFLPRWLNLFLYLLGEAAIIATDIAEVIGTAIGLNLLVPAIPLVAGCALSILDVFVILFFYRPNGSMNGLRVFEVFVMLLVLIVVVCFGIQLSLIKDTTPGEVFRGYLPSDVITKSDGLYQACGILGATVMPHSLYLGSGVVQSRLRDYDTKRGLLPADSTGHTVEDPKTGEKRFYVPSCAAIKHSLNYSYTEVTLTLVTFALFVNSAILIVAGASLYGNADAAEADIFSIHALLSESISPFAGVTFALALLFSGISAGIVCTISGQMLCEGAIRWTMKPWLRRLLTRSIAVTPSIIIAGASGRRYLNDALNGTQVVLSIVLPFVSAPLIWFTCFNKYMVTQRGLARTRVEGKSYGSNGTTGSSSCDVAGSLASPSDGVGIASNGAVDEEIGGSDAGIVKMANSWYVATAAVTIWLLIVVLNIANLVLLGRGS